VFFSLLVATLQQSDDFAYLNDLAIAVVASAQVKPNASIRNGGTNTTGGDLHVPGGTQSFYPAFWIRDAAMMIGVPGIARGELQNWIKVVAAVQPGPDGLHFSHGLFVPGFSVPDHITLNGEACWYPGAYTNQGDGHYGYLPPADDAFFFIQMGSAYAAGDRAAKEERLATPYGEQPLEKVLANAFDSVETDASSGMVKCSAEPNRTRVDWGFCDSVRKNGLCLMPSLLRWRAAREMADLSRDSRYRAAERLIADHLVPTFYRELPDGEGMLLSATGQGHKDDVWASAFAVWLGVLPKKVEARVAKHLLRLYRDGGTVVEGQIRQLPPTGEFGGLWESAAPGDQSYQNGGFWATPTGWFAMAIGKVDRRAKDQLIHEYADFVRSHRSQGAPFEWVNPATGAQSNGNYASSVGLVVTALRGFK
jgi:hypothetical protein